MNYFEETGTALYSEFIHKSRYARWLEDENRREDWPETVRRYFDFFSKRFPELKDEIMALEPYVLNFEVMPSMRTLMTAGKALESAEMANFNCSALTVDSPRAFDEALYILCCGVGMGFSVERQFVSQLPVVADEFYPTETTIVVKDSRVGWASAYRELISLLYQGLVPKWDVSKVRPAGAKLKTFGGRASGPGPLEDLFRFTINVFKKAAGRKLTSVECHDIVCKIADVVVVGGTRRSALISLSNLSDDRMRLAKSGQWWVDNKQRELANNSAAYHERPEFEVFLKEWNSLYESKSGERGIFNREAAKKKVRSSGRRDVDYDFVTNPCGEILLRPQGLCNLSEVVIRPHDTEDTLRVKVRVAAILGTLQSTVTDFKYVRKVWKKNAEEERLLGVSLTGIMDHPMMWNIDDKISKFDLQSRLDELKRIVIEENIKWAEKLGINTSVAVTTVKPSGTVSQLVNSSSGIHPRYSDYYIRTVRADNKDPLAQLMRDQGFPCEVSVHNPDILVFSFPIKSPEGSRTTKEMSAIDQLKLWKVYQDYWCEHNPSCTIYYKDDDFLAVGQWVWENFDSIVGLSFLPYSDHVYQQAPYQPISKEEYEAFEAKMPKSIDWALLGEYEKEDTTSGHKELACSGSVCEVVDLVK